MKEPGNRIAYKDAPSGQSKQIEVRPPFPRWAPRWVPEARKKIKHAQEAISLLLPGGVGSQESRIQLLNWCLPPSLN